MILNANQPVEFDAVAHVYRVGGVRLPSVTQILQAVGWINYGHIPRPTREMALERGRIVHHAVALDCFDNLDLDSMDYLAGYVLAARAALADLGIPKCSENLLVETPAWHRKWRYAGMLDLSYRDLLVDWKTNQAEWWVRYQLAAYGDLYTKAGAFRRIAIELHADGTYTPYEMDAVDYQADLNQFLSALSCFNTHVERKPLCPKLHRP